MSIHCLVGAGLKEKDERELQTHVECVEEHVRKQSLESLLRIMNSINSSFDAEISATRGE